MVPLPEPISQVAGFVWDEGNSEKNWRSHSVTRADAEQAFLNRPVVVAEDIKHSEEEPRFTLLGRTNADRRLFAAFTIRGGRVRIISARPMSRRERRVYAGACHAQAQADS